MSRVGVLLAAGSATRLPGKLWLPLTNGRPLFTSGLDYLLRQPGMDLVNVVVSPVTIGPVRAILNATYGAGCPVRLVVQPEPVGVLDAVRRGMTDHDGVLVVCGDNAYPSDPGDAGDELAERWPNWGRKEFVVTRVVPPWRGRHLARHGGHILTTPWSLRAERVMDRDLGSDDLLSCIRAVPAIDRPGGCWWDLGVPEVYERYMGCDGGLT